jgi:pimeloyl-ACP methyl ester carboxylesterase
MAELSLAARIGYVALLLAGLASAGVSGSLLIGERGLPARTIAALIVITAVGLSWAAFAAWTLAHRRALLAKQELIASYMAVAFTALFTAGAAAVGWSTQMEASWLAAGTGLVMLGVAGALLMRARRRVAELRSRRAELERRLSAVLVAALLAVAAFPASSQQPGTPMHRAEGGTFQVADAQVAVELGSFLVPANRTGAAGGMLTLRYVRFPSTAAVPGPPIVFLAGGPGDAATRAFQGMPMAILDSLRASADVIAFDQRGTGTSDPQGVACEGGTMLPRAEIVPLAARLRALTVQLRACLEEASARGVEVSGLTTAESADDLEALRTSLGASRLALLAGSYGTHLALAALRRHPRSIARVALLGVEGPDHTLKSPLRVDEVLARIAATRRPSLADDIRALRRRFSEAPVLFTFPTGQTLALSEWDLQRWIADALDTEREIEALLTALPAVLQGNYAEVARSALPYRLPRALNLMNVAVDCASSASSERLARIRAEGAEALLGNVMDFPLPELCESAGLLPLPSDFRTPVESEVPALLVSGSFDGRTPVANAVDVLRTLPNARHLVVEGASHDLFRRPEVIRDLIAFFREGR